MGTAGGKENVQKKREDKAARLLGERGKCEERRRRRAQCQCLLSFIREKVTK